MTILNIGSVNIDHVYRVARHPAPGETISDLGFATHLGGKGANMSLAAAMGESGEAMADMPNFTNAEAAMQVSEVVV